MNEGLKIMSASMMPASGNVMASRITTCLTNKVAVSCAFWHFFLLAVDWEIKEGPSTGQLCLEDS